MPSYQTQMKGATDWSDPEPHSDYRAAAGLELDVYLSDDVEIEATRLTVCVRDVDTQVVRDVDFELSDDDDESWKLVATS